MSDNKNEQKNDFFTPLPKEEWLKFIQDGKFDDGPVLEEYRGAGEHVKVVFDEDSRIVLSRILKKGGRVTFDDLVNNYGGYYEYYMRESILLAKRVYRYLNDLGNRYRKRNVSTIDFTPPNDGPETDWLDIIYKKEVSENENQTFWSVREKLEDAFRAKYEVDTKYYWGKETDTNEDAEEVIKELLRTQNKNKMLPIDELIKLKNKKGKNVSKRHILYFCATLPDAARSTTIYPNYFYTKDENSCGLTGSLGYTENKYDVINGNAKDTLRKIREKLDVKMLTKCSHGNTYQQYIPVQDDSFYGENSVHYEIIVRENRTVNYERVNDAIYVELHIENGAKVTKERKEKLKHALEAQNQKFFIHQNWMLIRLKDEEVKIKKNDGTDRNFDDILNDVKDRLEELYNNTEHILKVFFGGNMSYDITKIKNLLMTRKQLILNGAPGTGKTYTAKEIAACIVADENDAVEKDGVEQTDGEGKSGETTDDNSKITDVKNTVASQAEGENDFDKVNAANPDNHDTENAVAGQVSSNINPSDPPAKNQSSSRYESLGEGEKNRIKIVQFHPGYDYSDFIIGLKPLLIRDGALLTDSVSLSKIKTGNNQTWKNVTLSYCWQDGVFKEFVDEITSDNKKIDQSNTGKPDNEKTPYNKYVFIIDEINRADLSNVFGEAFSLLEKDYRGNEVILPSGHKFTIPDNLYIIGTMNDIDRSVESMDFALRRRFAWHEITANDSETIIDSRVNNQSIATALKNAMNAINSVIAGTPADQIDHDIPEGVKPLMNSDSLRNLGLGTEYQLGGAYFAPDVENINSDDTDQIKIICDDLWNHHIKVILNDYLRGNKNKDVIVNNFNTIYKVFFDARFNPPKESSPAVDADRTVHNGSAPDADEAARE